MAPSAPGDIVQTIYTSKDINVPDTFLTSPPARRPTAHPVPFAAHDLPEYEPLVAFTIDDVLSKDECGQLIQLAEDSVPMKEGQPSPWTEAKVNMGIGNFEAYDPNYRKSDRIIWDHQMVTDRIFERCLLAEGVRERLAVVDEGAYGFRGQRGSWELRRLNERMRFLRYSPGQFFKPHVDGSYGFNKDGKEFETHYTLHLYLNDSKEADPSSDLVGGATAFLSRQRKSRQRKIDVNPRAGSVLIFQHRGLLHEGSVVEAGTKYTVRSDVLYEWVPKKGGE